MNTSTERVMNAKASTNGVTDARPNALILAGSRHGADDPVARMQNKTHKCLVEIDGVVMLERVIDALVCSRRIGRIYVSIDSEQALRGAPRLEQWLAEGTIAVVPSEGNLADSVFAAAAAIPDPFPLVVTTGDNALHTDELIRDFVDQSRASDGDVIVSFTREEVTEREFPEAGLAYHRLKDGGISACNVYLIRNRAGLKSVESFRSGGQFGKRHLRILKAFGVMPFIAYKLKLSTVRQLMNMIGHNLDIRIDVVFLDYAFGPIDVDNPDSFALSERILSERAG